MIHTNFSIGHRFFDFVCGKTWLCQDFARPAIANQFLPKLIGAGFIFQVIERTHWSRSIPKNALSVGIRGILVTAILSLTACGPGRPPIPPGEIPRADIVSAEDEQYGQTVLAELMQQYPLDRSDNNINRVRDIVDRLAKAAHADRDPWHVYVLQGDTVINAAATRGNHVFVWTGMLRSVRSDDELATVLAHELGHVLAGHTMPTPTEEAQEILANVTGQVVGEIIQSQGAYGALAGIAGDLVSSVVRAIAINPESQRKELEADQIGFFLMADAGYDPRKALDFWTRMEQISGGDSSLQVLSTHPANEERLDALRAMLDQAMARYEKRTPPPSARVDKQKPRGAPAGNDSFAIDKEPQPPPTSEPHRSRSTDGEIWRVVEPQIQVHSGPERSTPVVATLRTGDKVTVEERDGRWYKILNPVAGFVRGVELSPE